MPSPQAKGAHHVDKGWLCPPESLTVETDRTSAFYDEGIEQSLPEWLIENIRVRGVLEPVMVVRDGERFVVVDGRKRHRAVIEANRRRLAAGQEPHEICYFIRRTADEADIIGLSAAANLHVADKPMMRARKAARMLEAGAAKEQVANDLGCKDLRTLDAWLALLDCAAVVQAAVDGGLAVSVAREIAALPRAQQGPALAQMQAKGATRGTAAKRAVAAVKQGQAVPAKSTAKRRRGQDDRTLLLAFLASLNEDQFADLRGACKSAIEGAVHERLVDAFLAQQVAPRGDAA